MKEIGGYFEFESLISNEFYSDLVAVNSARNALLYLLKTRDIKKLYIPYFLCNSVSDICDREGYDFEYYKIGNDFLPVFNKKLGTKEYIYIVNYYGQIDNQKVKELKNIYTNIIFDNVQAFFQTPVDGVDTIYSCRKFFGVPDGGYVATDVAINGILKTDISKDRMKHLLGRFEGDSASDYYEDFKINESSFRNIQLLSMSKLTHNIMGAIDYNKARKKREENFSFLHSRLGELNKLSVKVPIGPYAYPFYCEQGISIKKKLADKKIFVPTLWPDVLKLDDSIEKDYAENILPLPCDQRYDEEDMMRIIQEVMICINCENSKETI